MTDLTGYVLAGGTSRRMGTDKADLVLDGLTLAERAARTLGEVTSRVKIVGGRVDGWPTVSDVVDASGARASIYGLHAAFVDFRSEWAIVLACDLPFVPAGHFRKLREIAAARRTQPDAVAPVQPDGRPQPLAAIYRPSRCLPVVEAMLAAGELKLSTLLERLEAEFVPAAALGAAAEDFFNVNTPEDLRTAREMAAALRSRSEHV